MEAGELAGWAAAAAVLIAAAVKEAINWLRAKKGVRSEERKEEREEKREDRKDALEEWQKLLAFYKRQTAEQQATITWLTDRVRACEVAEAARDEFLAGMRRIAVAHAKALKELGHDTMPIPELPPKRPQANAAELAAFLEKTTRHNALLVQKNVELLTPLPLPPEGPEGKTDP